MSAAIISVGDNSGGGAQQRRIGDLQIRDESRGDYCLCQSRKGQMADHHRRHRNAQRIRRVERRSAGIVKQHGLNAELDGGNQRRGIDGE